MMGCSRITMWSLCPSIEKFDTSHADGAGDAESRIVFAQLERETIEAGDGRLLFPQPARGFKMGGKAPLWLPYRANHGRYQHKEAGGKPRRSGKYPADVRDVRPAHNLLWDITRYFAEQGILFNGKELITPHAKQMLPILSMCRQTLMCEFSKVKGQPLSMTLPIYRHEWLLSVSKAGCEAQQKERLEDQNAGAGSP